MQTWSSVNRQCNALAPAVHLSVMELAESMNCLQVWGCPCTCAPMRIRSSSAAVEDGSCSLYRSLWMRRLSSLRAEMVANCSKFYHQPEHGHPESTYPSAEINRKLQDEIVAFPVTQLHKELASGRDLLHSVSSNDYYFFL